MSGSGPGRTVCALAAACALVALPFLPAVGAPGSARPAGSLEAQEPGDAGPAVDAAAIPVLLVPGWGDSSPELAPLRARFIEAGWPPGRVAYMSFENPVGSNRDHAVEVAEEVRVLRDATGAERVDIIAHSMGGLAVRRFLVSDRYGVPLRSETPAGEAPAGAAVGGADPGRDSASTSMFVSPSVRRVVFLATPHRGTISAYFAWGEGSEEMQPGSPFLDSLNAAPPVPASVEALAIRTVVDLRVVPWESATLPDDENVRNVEVCCPTHPGLIDDDETFRVIAAFLRG